jgi:methylmalonyl-CoA mutase cobalamin-binding subunit
VPLDLPTGARRGTDLLAEGAELARSVNVGTTRMLRRESFPSEIDYRCGGRERGRFFTAMNVGMKDWPETVEAVQNIEQYCLSRGVRPPDRYQLIPERRMGLPMAARRDAPQETGPVLWDADDWRRLGECVEWIQPEVGDNMVGGPASVENTIEAIQAGSTYVGCLSQFSWRWPYFDDDIYQISEVVKACGILASKRDQGVLLDTYLEDGIAGTFEDYVSLVGWGSVERWIAGLCGCPLSVSWGGLTADPVTKTIVSIAMEMGNTERIPAAFVQGDTISYTDDLDQNSVICAQDTMYMMLVQSRYRTGACALPVPLTENKRIPTWEEIAQVQVMARQMERRIPDLARFVDWPRFETEAKALHRHAQDFVANVKSGLGGLGVDVTDALQIMVALSRLGAAEIERRWGIGAPDSDYAHGRRPIKPTELVAMTVSESAKYVPAGPVSGATRARVIVGSTDVHEMAKRVLVRALSSNGCEVIDIGVNRDPEDFVRVSLAQDAQAIVITTHNGVALSFGTKTMSTRADLGCSAEVFMGGVLNEDFPGDAMPLDVTAQLNELGIKTPGSVDVLLDSVTVSTDLLVD